MVDVPSSGYQPIENYGIIGDLYTVALVGMDGSIDFMAFPHFDSPTVFAALLDWQKGGRFQIAPRLIDARQKQLYLPDSNILLTRFLASDGVAEISDCMPVEEVEQAHNLVRRVKTVRGEEQPTRLPSSWCKSSRVKCPCRHVAIPQPEVGNPSGDAWRKRPGRPVTGLRWERPGGLASVGARRSANDCSPAIPLPVEVASQGFSRVPNVFPVT
jgi:hypothetical protein